VTIRLHTFGEAWGLADPSPFCLKLESFLREAGIAYVRVPFDPWRSFRRAPKGKLPFIEAEDGVPIGDSTLIIDRLSAERGIDLDQRLDPGQRAVSHAFRRMLDEHFYWVGVYARWCDEPGWSVVRANFFRRMPALVGPVAERIGQRRVRRALQSQGIGRHRPDEIYALGRADLESLARLLGDDPWFFAQPRPTLLDLWAHAFVAETVWPPIASPLKAAALALPNLAAHATRLQARLYPALPAQPA
jgi:glutathione S-transferase